tara:strand:- start:283 stop:501 length:219 start_codon:yes stop_codon:yes gene_type:complete
MIKTVLLMVLCSGLAGNECKVIGTDKIVFDDYRECIVYGYEYSFRLMESFDREWVNSMEVYTKFSCEEQESI